MKRKKFFKQRTRTLSTMLVVILSILFIATITWKIKAANASTSPEQADMLKACGELLRSAYDDPDKYFALTDLNADGILELLVKGESRLFTENYAYTYEDGQMLPLPWKDVPYWNSGVRLNTEEETFIFFSESWEEDTTYVREYAEYQLEDGEIYLVNDASVKEHHNSDGENTHWDYNRNGEDCEEEEYQELEDRFEDGEEIYYRQSTEEEWKAAELIMDDTELDTESQTKAPKNAVKPAKLSEKNKQARKAYQKHSAGLSKNKMKNLEQSLNNLLGLNKHNCKTKSMSAYGEMISYVMNREHTKFRNKATYDRKESLMKIKKKIIDTYLKKKFHLKAPKKKVLLTNGSSEHILVKEKKGYYYVQGADGEAPRSAKIISVKKQKGSRYKVVYDSFIQSFDGPATGTYEETLNAIVSYSPELKAWTFYKITSQGKLSGHPRKRYITI